VFNSDPLQRSLRRIERSDLVCLLQIAKDDRNLFFVNHPDWARLYGDRVLGTALCQGAALHYICPSVGINDFDVYTFYAAHPDRRWYAKRIRPVDYGDAKFGRSEVSSKKYVGRRVDLLARALDVPVGTEVAAAILAYLRAGRTATSRHLGQKAVVLLEPEERMGEVIWPITAQAP